jgi:putative alpha-1,2-mannosidase
MKKKINLVFTCVMLFGCFGEITAVPFDPVEYVNPLMGVFSIFELSSGNTYPAIALPWGMNCWTPQTGKMGNGWIYNIHGQ